MIYHSLSKMFTQWAESISNLKNADFITCTGQWHTRDTYSNFVAQFLEYHRFISYPLFAYMERVIYTHAALQCCSWGRWPTVILRWEVSIKSRVHVNRHGLTNSYNARTCFRISACLFTTLLSPSNRRTRICRCRRYVDRSEMVFISPSWQLEYKKIRTSMMNTLDKEFDRHEDTLQIRAAIC